MTNADKTVTRRRVALGVVVGILVVAVVVVAALGGFAYRSSQSVYVPLGQEIDNGEMVFLPESATVQYDSSSETYPWRIIAYLKVRNPQADALAPIPVFAGNIAGIDPQTRATSDVSSTYLGTPTDDNNGLGSTARQNVPPDNQWLDMQVTFKPDPSFKPGQTYMVGFQQMRYAVTLLFGYSTQKEWAGDPFARPAIVELPLTRLADVPN